MRVGYGANVDDTPQRALRRAETQAVAVDSNKVRLADAPPKSGAFLAATKGELESAIKELVELNGRLGALADRVFGSQPETTGREIGGPAVTIGATAEIEERVNAIHLLVQAAHYTAARLEKL